MFNLYAEDHEKKELFEGFFQKKGSEVTKKEFLSLKKELNKMKVRKIDLQRELSGAQFFKKAPNVISDIKSELHKVSQEIEKLEKAVKYGNGCFREITVPEEEYFINNKYEVFVGLQTNRQVIISATRGGISGISI